MGENKIMTLYDKIKENLKLFHNSNYGKIVETGVISGVIFFTLNKIFRGGK